VSTRVCMTCAALAHSVRVSGRLIYGQQRKHPEQKDIWSCAETCQEIKDPFRHACLEHRIWPVDGPALSVTSIALLARSRGGWLPEVLSAAKGGAGHHRQPRPAADHRQQPAAGAHP
jgi:hypothetical protein